MEKSTIVSRVYGGRNTIHQTGEVNVELDKKGNVVAVWFRCQAIPFTQHVVDDARAESMRAMSARPLPSIIALEVQDPV